MVYLVQLAKNKKAFTLIELIMVLAFILIVAGFSIPFYENILVKNSLEVAKNDIVQTFRRAKLQSENMLEDSTWGIKVISGQIILFKGDDYVSRDTSYDETIDFSTGIINYGIDEVVFSKLDGQPSLVGTMDLSLEGDTKTITINSKGIVSY